jgi:flagellin
MTQQQVLTQAATSVLAQANSAPQAILKLLQ